MTAAKAGADTATQTITAQANAGIPVEQIDRHHQDVAAWLFSEAQDDDARAFAAEYNRQAETLVTELRHCCTAPSPTARPAPSTPTTPAGSPTSTASSSAARSKAAGRRQDRELEAG